MSGTCSHSSSGSFLVTARGTRRQLWVTTVRHPAGAATSRCRTVGGAWAAASRGTSAFYMVVDVFRSLLGGYTVKCWTVVLVTRVRVLDSSVQQPVARLAPEARRLAGRGRGRPGRCVRGRAGPRRGEDGAGCDGGGDSVELLAQVLHRVPAVPLPHHLPHQPVCECSGVRRCRLHLMSG